MKHTFVPLSLFFLPLWHLCTTTNGISAYAACTAATSSPAIYNAGNPSNVTHTQLPKYSNNVDISHQYATNLKKSMTQNNDARIRKFLTIVLTMYKKKLLVCIANQKGQDAAKTHKLLNYFDHLYDLIDILPITELLDALDEAIEEIYPLLEFYEFDSFMSWQEWLQKYTWLIPLLVGKFIYIIFSKLEFIENDICNEDENGCEAESSQIDSTAHELMYQPSDTTEFIII